MPLPPSAHFSQFNHEIIDVQNEFNNEIEYFLSQSMHSGIDYNTILDIIDIISTLINNLSSF
jgi:hypothetical protein